MINVCGTLKQRDSRLHIICYKQSAALVIFYDLKKDSQTVLELMNAPQPFHEFKINQAFFEVVILYSCHVENLL